MHIIRHLSSQALGQQIISESGGRLRDDFVTQLEELGIKQKPSSAYHSPAKQAVGSLKSVFKKSRKRGYGRALSF